jgi:hypothetical protein
VEGRPKEYVRISPHFFICEAREVTGSQYALVTSQLQGQAAIARSVGRLNLVRPEKSVPRER